MESLIEAAAGLFSNTERRNVGVAVATVVDNLDATSGGRVQVELPWLPELMPWARVASFSAGDSRGAFFMPQVGDEVLVAFQHGDVREPFVIGSLWNGTDKPPATAPNDAVSKRIIKTPAGHEIVLDDNAQSITITSASKQVVKIETSKIEVSAGNGAATVKLENSGKIEVQASVEIKLKAPTISLEGTTIDVKATGAATLQGSASTSVQGGIVRIN